MTTTTKPAAEVNCPVCKGAGKQTIQTTTHSYGKVEKSSFDMTCNICDGAKTMSKRRAQAILRSIKREQELWCSCKNADLMNSTFCDDGTCSDCEKHHFHCGTCNKICQVG